MPLLLRNVRGRAGRVRTAKAGLPTRMWGLTMRELSKRDWLVVALFAFVTIGTALVILNWLAS